MNLLTAIFFVLLSMTLLVLMVNMCIWTWMDIQDKRHERKIEILKAEHRHSEI